MNIANTIRTSANKLLSGTGKMAQGNLSTWAKMLQGFTGKTASSTQMGYVKSTALKNAEAVYNSWKNSMPKAPTLSYTSQINSLISKLSGRKFTYDHTTDPAYISGRDTLMEQGRIAMEDTAGSAAAKTGGYSNSYAVSAANQAYNNYASQVGELIPELYEAAYDRYRDETEELYDRIEVLSSLNDAEWERYTDALSSYYDEGKILQDELERISDDDFNRYKLLINKD